MKRYLHLLALLPSLALADAARNPVQLDLEALHSDNLSDWSPALSFDILWQKDLPGDSKSWEMAAKFQAQGTVALDADLVREPLRAAFDFGAARMLPFPTAPYSPMPNDPSAKQKAQPLWFNSGLSVRYETDQTFDHRNGVGSAFLGLSNLNVENGWSLLPSLRVAIEGVESGENTTANAIGASPGSHGRFTASADWRIGFAMFGTGSDFLNRLHLHAALEYARDFGTPQKYDAAGLDETFGGLVELAYNFDTGVKSSGRPRSLFVRGQFGTLRPLPEDDRSLMIGVRFGF